MTVLSKFWNNFKSAPDVWFFYGFLLTFTLSVRKVLFFYPINGRFNEWTGIYLYLSDIFLLLTLFLWSIAILRNKNVNLSIDNINLWLKKAIIYLPRHQKQGITRWWVVIKEYVACKFSNRSVGFWCGGVPILLVFWSFISILWSENQNIALFKVIKLLELFLLYIYVMYQVVPRRTNMKNIFRVIIVLGFIQAVIGIWQFIIQHSIDLFWLKESLISPNIPGVAKIVLNGEKFIRAYGLFPHPNILGGFLLVSIILTIFYKRLFRPVNSNFIPRGTKLEHGASVEQFDICHPELDSGSNEIPGQARNDICLGLGMTILLIIQIIALILTFSKSAILGLIIAIIYIFWKKKEIFHLSSLFPLSRRGSEGRVAKIALIATIILILSLYLAGLNFGENLEKSYGDRLSQLVTWKSITQNNLLLGVGVGNYMFHMEQNYPNLETWQYQPVHNVLLLIFSELGFIGLFIFVWFLWKLFHPRRNVPCGTSYGAGVKQSTFCHPELDSGFNVIPAQAEIQKNNLLDSGSGAGMTLAVFKGIFIGLIFIMFFDHYFWDIQQGQIMLWLVLGLLAGIQNSENKLTKIGRPEIN